MTKSKPSFQQAIEFSALWIKAWEVGELSDEVLADRIAELIETHNGMRGFFAIALSIDSPLLDRLPEPIVIQLRSSGEKVVDITVKNLAMSSAMALVHQRNFDQELQSKSERVTARCKELLKLLEPNEVKSRLEKILKATQGKGQKEDNKFLEKWDYDNEQKEAIALSIYSVASN
ncbi:hypothetical protein [Prochlorococcus sp. MIT 1341]|uniref:hypothetical protein n=1 Tax=Prochlorococcus sp. MIT 1341 TaxID=3096221 RepID=UPI002A74CE34|nr:hypothetical protein [Prochlorococcus sp. MIT 1341]